MAPEHTNTLASGTVETAAGGAVFITPNPAPKNADVRFFTRLGGVSEPPFYSLNISTKVGDTPENVVENLSRIKKAMDGNPSAWVKQVAGDAVVHVSEGGFAGEADALITREENLGLVVGVADCVPVALVGECAVGMVHSGWRGTLSGISGNAAKYMGRGSGRKLSDVSAKGKVEESGGNHSGMSGKTSCEMGGGNGVNATAHEGNFVAYIGPCIRRCCYEVSEELAGEFADEFGEGVVSGRYLSLPDAIRVDLERSGVSEIHDLGICAGCRLDLFFSHRMEKPVTGRNLAAVSMKTGVGE